MVWLGWIIHERLSLWFSSGQCGSSHPCSNRRLRPNRVFTSLSRLASNWLPSWLLMWLPIWLPKHHMFWIENNVGYVFSFLLMISTPQYKSVTDALVFFVLFILLVTCMDYFYVSNMEESWHFVLECDLSSPVHNCSRVLAWLKVTHVGVFHIRTHQHKPESDLVEQDMVAVRAYLRG